MKRLLVATLCALTMMACKISYSFQTSSIDYNIYKTIELREFTNQASLVYAPLTQVFNERIQDVFTRNTKLSFVDVGADIELEGEIIRYDLTPMAVKEDAYASETRLTMAVKIRYRDNKNSSNDKEETITSYQDFSSDKMLNDVQDELIDLLTKDIIDQIYNTTLSNW